MIYYVHNKDLKLVFIWGLSLELWQSDDKKRKLICVHENSHNSDSLEMDCLRPSSSDTAENYFHYEEDRILPNFSVCQI